MGDGEHIVIAIDFGTTYSAVAWTCLTNPESIDVVDRWPTQGQQPLGIQVPTEIAYGDQAETENRSISWGYNLSPRDRTIKWFKLGLETDDEGMTLPSGMDTVSITRDYLHALNAHVTQVISRRLSSAALQDARYSYILTVPAIWSDNAKERTKQAATDAGLGDSDKVDLTLYSEPESAAVFILRTMEGMLHRVNLGDKFVVCDAGGGTVDLISYELKQIDPYLQMEECSMGTGDYCGSSFIDKEFENLFQQRLGFVYDSLSIAQKQRVIKNFETSKIAFRNDENCPTFYVSVPGVSTISSAGIREGFFEMSRQEMKSLFDPIVTQVLELLKEQIASQQDKAKFILLVGGFGESEYLYLRIQEWAEPQDIQVLQPRDAATAIVKGAVLKGLEQKILHSPRSTRVTRRARRSYGVITCEIFDPEQHLESDAIYEVGSMRKLAQLQVHWFIKANQLITDEETFRYGFSRIFTDLEPWRDVLVSSESPTPPTRVDEQVQYHCVMRSDLTHLSPRHDFRRHRIDFRTYYYTADYDLVLSLKDNNLTLTLSFNGKDHGLAAIEFDGLPI